MAVEKQTILDIKKCIDNNTSLKFIKSTVYFTIDEELKPQDIVSFNLKSASLTLPIVSSKTLVTIEDLEVLDCPLGESYKDEVILSGKFEVKSVTKSFKDEFDNEVVLETKENTIQQYIPKIISELQPKVQSFAEWRQNEWKDDTEVVKFNTEDLDEWKKIIDISSDTVYFGIPHKAILGLLPKENKIDLVLVLREFRHNGLAKELMKFAIDKLDKHRRIISRIEQKNTVAIKLYQEFGFKEYDNDEVYSYMELKPKIRKENYIIDV